MTWQEWVSAYAIVRKIALYRAGYCCEECGTEERLTTHHIIRKAHAPSLALSEDNLKVLCRACHKRVERRINEQLKWEHISRNCPERFYSLCFQKVLKKR